MKTNFSNDSKWGMVNIDWDCLAAVIKLDIDEDDVECFEEGISDNKEFCELALEGMDPDFRDFMIRAYQDYNMPVCEHFE